MQRDARIGDWKSVVLLCLAFAASGGLANAEHRVALLIDNGKHSDSRLAMPAADLKVLSAGLEKYGFRCEVTENLDEKQLKTSIERFGDNTPTRGTALVYFRGPCLLGSYNGQPKTCLLGTNSKPDRGYPIELALQALNRQGGSDQNLLLLDCPLIPEEKTELPSGCLLAFVDRTEFMANMTRDDDLIDVLQSHSQSFASSLPDNVSIAGKGSVAISPPDRFVAGKRAGDEWMNRRGMVFCWCPPGSYIAGSPEGTPGRYPDEAQREVAIKTGFWIGKYEMTLSQNLRNHPSRTIAEHKNHPLTMINHDDAKTMTLRTLSESERKEDRLPKDWQYSLPTEDQWEYAARAGMQTRFYFGDDLRQLPQHANFSDKSFYDSKDIYSNAAHRTLDDGAIKLAVVGSYEPNPWGLFDMYGNVAEWCINYAIRGGSWVSVAENCRSAYRDSFSSRNEQNFIGYRLAIQQIPASQAK